MVAELINEMKKNDPSLEILSPKNSEAAESFEEEMDWDNKTIYFHKKCFSLIRYDSSNYFYKKNKAMKYFMLQADLVYKGTELAARFMNAMIAYTPKL